MSINNKKGVFFIIDIVFGFIILAIGLSLLVNFYYQVPESNQLEIYSSDATFFFSSTKVGSVKNSEVVQLLNASIISEKDFFGESLSQFCQSSDASSYNLLVGGTLTDLIPSQLNYVASVLYLNESPCLTFSNGDVSTYNDSSLASSNRVLILGLNDSYNEIGPYIFEVRVW